MAFFNKNKRTTKIVGKQIGKDIVKIQGQEKILRTLKKEREVRERRENIEKQIREEKAKKPTLFKKFVAGTKVVGKGLQSLQTKQKQKLQTQQKQKVIVKRIVKKKRRKPFRRKLVRRKVTKRKPPRRKSLRKRIVKKVQVTNERSEIDKSLFGY